MATLKQEVRLEASIEGFDKALEVVRSLRREVDALNKQGGGEAGKAFRDLAKEARQAELHEVALKKATVDLEAAYARMNSAVAAADSAIMRYISNIENLAKKTGQSQEAIVKQIETLKSEAKTNLEAARSFGVLTEGTVKAQRAKDLLARSAINTARAYESLKRSIIEADTAVVKQIDAETKALISEKKLETATIQKEAATKRATKADIDAEAAKIRLQRATLLLEKSLNSAKQANLSHSDATNKSTQDIFGMIRALRALPAVAAAAWAVNQVRQYGMAIIEATVAFEKYSTGIKNTFGTSLAFAENMAFLKGLSDEFAFEINDISESFFKFSTAAKLSGLTLEQTQQIFRSVTIAGRAMNLNSRDLNYTFLALEQMASKGVVSMEELRRQLGERIPGAVQLAAKAMGLTNREFEDMVRNGELLASDFLPRFGVELEKAFSATAVGQMDTMSAAIGRMDNAWQQFSIAVGEFFKVPYTNLLNGFSRAFEAASALMEGSVAKLIRTENERTNANIKRRIGERKSVEDLIALRDLVLSELPNNTPQQILDVKLIEEDFSRVNQMVKDYQNALVTAQEMANEAYNEGFNERREGEKWLKQLTSSSSLDRIQKLKTIEELNRRIEEAQLAAEARANAEAGKAKKAEEDAFNRAMELLKIERDIAKIRNQNTGRDANEAQRKEIDLQEMKLNALMSEYAITTELNAKLALQKQIQAEIAKSRKMLAGVPKKSTFDEATKDIAIDIDYYNALIAVRRKFGKDTEEVDAAEIRKIKAQIEERGRAMSSAEQSFLEKRRKEYEKLSQEEQDRIVKEFNDGVRQIQESAKATTDERNLVLVRQYTEALEELIVAYKAGEIGVEDFEKAKKQLSDTFKAIDIENEIYGLTDALETLSNLEEPNLLGADKGKAIADIQARIAELNKALAELRATTESVGKSFNDNFLDLTRSQLDIINASFNSMATLARDFYGLMAAYRQQDLDDFVRSKEEEIRVSEGNAQKQEALRRQIEDRQRQARIEEAKARKAAAIFDIVLSTAQGIVNVLATGGPAGPTLAAIIGATGAAQLAIANAMPLPKFKDGVIDFQGKGTETSDSNIVAISKGESVIKASATKKYKPMLEQMNNLRFEPTIPVNALNVNASTDTMVKELKAMRKELSNLKQVNVNVDKGGLDVVISQSNVKTRILNSRYRE